MPEDDVVLVDPKTGAPRWDIIADFDKITLGGRPFKATRPASEAAGVEEESEEVESGKNDEREPDQFPFDDVKADLFNLKRSRQEEG